MSGQRSLLQSIFNDHPVADWDPRGLAVYRRNLLAGAARALAISFPTVTCLVGKATLTGLAGDFLKSRGRSTFDWGQWGGEFPAWIADHALSREHPYLADTALLDWLMHCAQRAEDPRPDYESFSALESMQTLDFSLLSAPGRFLLDSAFPIVAIHTAHRRNPAAPDLGEAAAMLRKGRGQTALIWRRELTTCLREVAGEERFWLRLLDEGSAATVAEVIQDRPADSMPFEQWLDRAIREQLVIGLSLPTPT